MQMAQTREGALALHGLDLVQCLVCQRDDPNGSRDRADRDIDHYLKEGAAQAALGSVDAIEDAFALLGRHPGLGASRYAYELDLPGLRSWPLRRFPYLIFSIELEDRIDVWRVLHNRRDIPATMQGLD